MTTAARQRLGEQQAELLRALLAGGPTPASFDHQRLAVQAEALFAKRRRIIAGIRPELREALDTSFDGYARAHPWRTGVSAREDAERFARWAGVVPRRPWWRRLSSRA